MVWGRFLLDERNTEGGASWLCLFGISLQTPTEVTSPDIADTTFKAPGSNPTSLRYDPNDLLPSQTTIAVSPGWLVCAGVLHSDRPRGRRSIGWPRPYRNTSHSPGDCRGAGCKSPVYSGRSSPPPRSPAGRTHTHARTRTTTHAHTHTHTQATRFMCCVKVI